MRFFLSVAAFLFYNILSTLAQHKAASATVTQEPAAHFAQTITTAELRRHLTELASDEYQGRGMGQEGQKKAATYLTQQYQLLGLQKVEPAAASAFLQPFTVIRTVPTNFGWLEVNGHKFEGLKDFAHFGSSRFDEGSTPADPVFRGYGIESKDYHDYTGKPDVRGKDVLVLEGEPSNGRGHYLFSGSKQAGEWSSVARKAYEARAQGARSLTVIFYATPVEFQQMLKPMLGYLATPSFGLATPLFQPSDLTLMTEYQPAYISIFISNTDVGLALLGTTQEVARQYENACYRQKKSVAAPFLLAPFRVQLQEQRQELATENVLGFVEGTDKKEEVLVVSAHYDHIGVRHDTIFNGADGSGSCTSAVLALANAFQEAKRAGQGPRRSILFLLAAGEEQGLLGSSYYATHPAFPLSQTVANLNLAMLGRTDKRHTSKDQYVYLIGTDRSSIELHQLSEATNARTTRLKLDYFYNSAASTDHLYYRSDHYNFARYGIPVIAYTSGFTPDYQRATDDVENIDFDKLAERTRLVFYTAWEIANRDQRLVVDSNKK